MESNVFPGLKHALLQCTQTITIVTLSKNDEIYSATRVSLDDVSFWKFARVSSGDSSLVMSSLPKVQDVRKRKSRSVNTRYIFTILYR